MGEREGKCLVKQRDRHAASEMRGERDNDKQITNKRIRLTMREVELES